VRVRNFTDLDAGLIRGIVRAVRPGGISRFTVQVNNTAYRGAHGHAKTLRGIVVIKVARTDARARTVLKARGAYLPHTYGSRIEAFLFVLAHELRHLWQTAHKRGRVWGSRGRYSERDADAYALRMLRAFRRGDLDLSMADTEDA
jgi:hypothetical protein